MKNIIQSLVFLLFIPLYSLAQYPPIGLNIGTLTTAVGGTVDVPVTAGVNFQNITHLQGTFTYDPSVISWNSMQNFGLSNPGGATFSVVTPGIINFTWSSLISVGPTLSVGANVFTLRFNVIGAYGQSSPVNFISGSTLQSWNNGFGWSGNNFAVLSGMVNIGCVGPNTTFNAVQNFYQTDFVDASSNASSWFWDFGDGSTATTQNANHTFAAPGSYTVCLVSTNACSTDSSCQTIVVCPNVPIANFTNTSSNLTGIFTNSSTGSPTSILWNFGDGGTSTNNGTIIHNFPSAGIYTVCLIATNGCGVDTLCQNVTIACPTPTAGWTSTSNDLSISFADQTVNPYAWAWSFGDGGTSIAQNPTHIYSSPGIYSVCLVSYNSCGGDTSCQTVTVTCPAPSPAFSSVVNQGAVSFTDLSTLSPTSWAWSFGDGGTSVVQNPTHTYADTGVYQVCLVAGSLCGMDTTCQAVTLNWLGLEEMNANLFEISPNPAKDFIKIHALVNEKMILEIVNVQGQKILTKEIQNDENIPTQNWERGAYILKISTPKNTLSKKVVLE
ncbi:MAG: PKD domain-containing protein [Crocinitomicaceae bacterium]